MLNTHTQKKRNGNVKFVAEPAMAPQEATVDPKLMEQYNQDFAEAANAQLPDDDEL